MRFILQVIFLIGAILFSLIGALLFSNVSAALSSKNQLLLFSAPPQNVPYHQITNPTLNVLSFGAIGNGVHDDSVSIQSALDAASNAGGGTVYLPGGHTYYVSQSQCVHSNTTVTGDGATSVIIVRPTLATGCTNGITWYGVFVLQATNNSGVTDLKIDLAANGTHANPIAIVPAGDHSGDTGTTTTISKNTLISGLTITGVVAHEYLIWNLRGQYTTITNNTINGNVPPSNATSQQEGIEIYGGKNIVITGNTLTNTGSDGVLVWQYDIGPPFGDTSVNNVLVSGNTATGAQNGMTLAPITVAGNITVTGNTFTNNANSGVEPGGTSTSIMHDITISNNTISGGILAGINFSTSGPSYNLTVSGNNVVMASSAVGVGAFESSENNMLVSGNTFTGGYIPISTNGSDNILFTGNTVSGGSYQQYYLVGTNLTLQGEHNLVSDASTPGATVTMSNHLMSNASPTSTISIVLWEALPGFGSSNVTLPAGVVLSPLTSLDGGVTWTGRLTQTPGAYGSGLVTINTAGAWASTGNVSGVISGLGDVSYGGSPPYTPKNYLTAPEPLLVQLSGVVDVTQASFTENGLANGAHWSNDISVSSVAYEFLTPTWPLQSNTNYTLSVYAVTDAGAAPNTGGFYFRVPVGTYGATVGFGSQECDLVSGSLYRCWIAFNTGSTPTPAANAQVGVGMTANPAKFGVRWTGFQLAPGTTPPTYSNSY